MKPIEIAILMKRKFSEFYDIKEYKKQTSEQLVVRRYAANNQKIIVDEKKSNG